MKTQFKTILILTLALAIFGCSKDDNNPPKVEPTAVLTGISPDSGPKNTVVAINGDNFGTDASKIKITFNKVEAAVQSVTNTQITTTVPPRSYSGSLTVFVNGKELDGGDFMYLNSEWIVSTFSGSTQGYSDGPGTTAQFDSPHGVAFDSQGNMYVADTGNDKIRKIIPEGMVSTLAGSTNGFADGAGPNAKFHTPFGVGVDILGNVYVADLANFKIRKITPNGEVGTLAGGAQGFADGIGAAAQFDYPADLVVDDSGNVYVVDSNNHKIRKITPNGEVSTFAGSTEGFADGSGTTAKFADPRGIAIDVQGNLYVADTDNCKIRKITTDGEVSTLAGSIPGTSDGTGTAAQFSYPYGMEIDERGDIYVVDKGSDRIRKISPNGEVVTIAGGTQGFADGIGKNAQFSNPDGLAIDSEGHIYVGDQSNHRIRLLIWE